ncbi:uncharacterized protein LOC128957806 [Oppia nitens]|uniref:uncharacterized protein LOC128957806 n=1 Tax=Oppia nitens TaxID=1686743 RepID=UPI0023DA8CC1|nr:uncharacterized protein LOC128957806 [Oppia nitens]
MSVCHTRDDKPTDDIIRDLFEKTIDINNNMGCNSLMNTIESNHCHQSGGRKTRKIDYRRYRSGSSSDSAINFEQSFEENNELLINEKFDIFDDFNEMIYNFLCLILQNQIQNNSPVFRRALKSMRKYYHTFDGHNCVDKFGFISIGDNELSNRDTNHQYFEHLLSQLLDINSRKHWSESCQSIKCLIRDYGIPNDMRQHVWLVFIRSKIDINIDINDILNCASNESMDEVNGCQSEVYNQIDLDIKRTVPNHHMFIRDDQWISKLRNILIGYCIHVNPRVGYCQGMNFIAALLLIVFDGNQEYSLMGFIAIIDHYFPPHYYDHHLTGARADQMLLKDLISTITTSANIEGQHLSEQMREELTNALSLNWFLSLYHSAVPWQVRLYIMDCFWLEGVKVLFRFGLALIKMGLDKDFTDETNSSGEMIYSIREAAKNCYDVIDLKRVAFNEIKLPKRKYMATKRSFYVKQITSQLERSIQSKESTTQWFRRRSSELLLGLKANNNVKIDYRIVISSDRSKVVLFCKNNRFVNELSILCTDNMKNCLKTHLFLKNAFIIGVTNNAKKIVCSNRSYKTTSKVKDGINVELIGVTFDICDGFYIEELESAIIVGKAGLVCRYDMINKKQTDSSMIFNDKSSKIVAADVNTVSGLVWLDTLSSHNNTHNFIAVDIKNLDIYTTIETDCFTIHKFSINISDFRSIIVVKSDPFNGKLRKAIDIITDNSHKQKLFDFKEEILDIKCFLFSDCTNIHNKNDYSVDCNGLPINLYTQQNMKSLIILLTKESSNILIEYNYENRWRKVNISHKFSDINEINAIRFVKLVKEGTQLMATLLS